MRRRSLRTLLLRHPSPAGPSGSCSCRSLIRYLPGRFRRRQEEPASFPGHRPNPKLKIALELKRIALQDEYFIKRRLYPNVDSYSGIIYQAMGFTPDMFTVLFAIPRTVGWLAQWQEMLKDPEQKIARPRQLFGRDVREFLPVENMAAKVVVVTA